MHHALGYYVGLCFVFNKKIGRLVSYKQTKKTGEYPVFFV